MKLKNQLVVLAFFCFALTNLMSQSYIASPISKYKLELDKKFKKYEVYELNIENMFASLKTRGIRTEVNLVAGSHNWNLELFENDIFSKNYVRSIGDNNGVHRSNVRPIQSYVGNISGLRGGNVIFSISKDVLIASIEYNGTIYYIENLKGLVEDATSNEIIIYQASDVIENKDVLCGFEATKQISVKTMEPNSDRGHCLIVEVALACDYSVYLVRGHGSDAWASGILALVAGNFDDEFGHRVEMDVAGTFVALSQIADPWYFSTTINEHLSQHVLWGNGGGYGVGYDVATAWTRKYTGGVVGLAYLGVVCTSNRYNVCSDFSGIDNINRQLQAHELGHNFNAIHDNGGSYIMAPVVNGSSTWSLLSIGAINSHMLSRGCLGSCGNVEPPEAAFSATPISGCIPLTVEFTDLSYGYPNNWLWTFPGGIPSTSTDRNPIVTYNSIGTYDVTLVVSNSAGTDSEMFSDYIEIDDKPTCVWSEVVDLRHVDFTDNSERADSWFWKFGDGNTSTERNPSHDYLKDGTYNVCLKTTNSCGSKEVCKRIDVYTPVTADFEIDNQDGCAPYYVTFRNNSSDNATSFKWTFPGGTPSTSLLREPTIVYNKKGEYDVTLQVSNKKYSDQKSYKKYIRIDTLPIAEFGYNASGLLVDFSNLSIDGILFDWSFGDGKTSKDKNPSHSYANAGQYNVRLITTNNCGTDTAFHVVTASGALVANFKVENTMGCAPYTVTFTNLSQNATTYNWSFPGGIPATSNLENPTVTYANSGAFDVSLNVSNGAGTIDEKKTSYILVENNPEALYTHTIKRFDAIFTNESKYGSSYLWNFGDNSTPSTVQSPTHTYAAEGEYIVKLSVTNGCGTVTYEKLVPVYLIPKVNFSSNTRKVCAGDTVHFKDLSSKDVINWDWNFSGSNISSSKTQNPSVIYEVPGVYGVKLTVANTNGNNSITELRYIEVKSSIKCPDKTGDKRKGPRYKGGVISTRMQQDFEILPNPASDKIELIGLNPDIELTAIDIYSINGLLVKQCNIVQNSRSIDVSSLNSGVYFIQVNTENSTYIQKLVIE